MNAKDYYLRIISVAAKSTYSHTGITTSVWAYIFASFFVGGLWFCYADGVGRFSEKWHEFVVFTVVGGMGVWALVFLGCLVAAPFQVHRQDFHELARMRSGCEPAPLSFSVDDKSLRHVIQYNNAGEMRRIGLKNLGNVDLKNVRIKFVSVQMVRPKGIPAEAYLSSFIHSGVCVKHGENLDTVFPAQEIDLDIATASMSTGPGGENSIEFPWRLHRRIWNNSVASDDPIRIPKGCYLVKIEAVADGFRPIAFSFFLAESTRKGFLIAPTKGISSPQTA